MSGCKIPKIGSATTISDIDLDEEQFYVHGEQLTESRAEQLAAETLTKVRQRNLIPGGKSLSGDGSHSPQVHVRLSRELAVKAKQKAAAEGISVSKLTRRALEDLLQKAG